MSRGPLRRSAQRCNGSLPQQSRIERNSGHNLQGWDLRSGSDAVPRMAGITERPRAL